MVIVVSHLYDFPKSHCHTCITITLSLVQYGAAHAPAYKVGLFSSDFRAIFEAVSRGFRPFPSGCEWDVEVGKALKKAYTGFYAGGGFEW